MPIRVLQKNIVNTFRQIGHGSIPNFTDPIRKGFLNPAIKYSVSKSCIKFPYADCTTKQININEVFLSYIWSLSYSIFVIFEKAVLDMSDDWDGIIRFNTKLLIQTKKLLDWALSLNAFYSNWDFLLPNPEKPNNKIESDYCLKINGLFVNSVSYILFHEYAHLAFDHCSFSNKLKKKLKSNWTDEEVAKYRQFEKQADDFAFDSLIKQAVNEEDRFKIGLSIVLAHISMLLSTYDPRLLKQAYHPDTDIRLESAILKLNFMNEDYIDYMWIFGDIACMAFFKIHNIRLSLRKSNSKEMFKKFMEEFEKLKNN
jgi:hypothetical protein